MLGCSKDNLSRQSPSWCIYSNNKSHPLSITRLESFSIALFYLKSTDNFSSWSDTHLKTSFIHIIDIFLHNPILLSCLHSFKPVFNKLRIFTFYTLIIIFLGVFWLQFWVVLDITVNPVFSNSNWLRGWWSMVCRDKKLG